jgi:hypothetical protein
MRSWGRRRRRRRRRRRLADLDGHGLACEPVRPKQVCPSCNHSGD